MEGEIWEEEHQEKLKLIQTLENETHDENVEGLNNEASGGFEDIHSDSGGESELSLNMEEEHRFDDSDEMDLDHRDACSESNHDLGSSLADWAIEFGISLMGLPALLSILKPYHPSLPKDGRTLLKTKTKHNIETVAGRIFHYFGIFNAFHKSG